MSYSDKGWIKIHRCLLDHPIWNALDSKQKVIMLTILLKANHEPKRWMWKGKEFFCKQGQFITSFSNLAEECGNDISVQNVRTCIHRLNVYNFLTCESTNSGSLITIVNWDKWQSGVGELTSELTGGQHAPNTHLTTNKNDKNYKNRNNKIEASDSYMAACEEMGVNWRWY